MIFSRRQQQGSTLVELLVSIVIVSIAASTILGVISMTTAGSADPMIRHQAAAIAEAYLEEILLKPLTDPDGVDGEAARADFDDLDDYDGLSDAGARDQFGNPMAGLGNYNVAVSVGASAALPAVPAADAFRVDVVVSHTNDVNFALSGYRTRF
ncbi:MAG: prepilin-type N-terminal cleavage/methylation domain-containing protein [Gammaproteobacteria bacterium]|nr:prepilin-type N-terminal cleavage/methylation domain-containing protein [Gammaproteobacteria bacterium]